MKRIILNIILFSIISSLSTFANKTETINTLYISRNLNDTIDLHILSSQSPIANNAIIDIENDDAWLFFDHVKPSDVIKLYAGNINIKGKTFDINSNVRVAIYAQGSVVIPQGSDFKPLTLYSKTNYEGEYENFISNSYYTNNPETLHPASMVKTFTLDNKAHSFILKRGYMATLANEPTGLGFSRIFIADDSDIKISNLPYLLDGKISFVRVMKWQYSSKKGWCGSYWKEIVSGLQYAPEQCNITNSTWYYNWGTSKTVNPNKNDTCYNQEFVPEKWGAGGSWKDVFSITDSPHLLGYNEPDHTEQSNVSVATAIEEWPNMLKTGLRLGSPATTDFTWLYSFMSEARKRNYRVDYVAVHAYWGGLTGDQWYAKLKDIYEKTGRPLWITEWNNGANWTTESWPSGTAAQQAKQLSDLKNILTVMDTAQFVERYAIYNWVEDKRAIILETGKLTPAGEYYTADTPRVAFVHNTEVIPTWTVREAPTMTYDSYLPDSGVRFCWSDYNGELIRNYALERSEDGQTYQTIDSVSGTSCTINSSYIDEKDCSTYFRVKSVPIQGSSQTSNSVSICTIDNTDSKMISGRLLINENWRLAKINNSLSEIPVILLGPPTYRNKIPLSWRIRHIFNDAFDFRLTTWDYQLKPTLANPDTIAYVAFPKGTYQSDNMTLLSDTVRDVNQIWKKVTFKKPFSVVPLVFTTQISDSTSSSASVRVRNITTNGFEVKLQYENTIILKDISESIDYTAITPGTDTFFGKRFKVGITPANIVGNNLSGGYRINCGEGAQKGVFFASMQTYNDSITSVLRIKERTDSTITIIKDRETSNGNTTVSKEQAAWMLIYDDNLTNAVMPITNNILSNKNTVYDINGIIIKNISDLNDLRNGIYFIKTNDRKVFKYIKK